MELPNEISVELASIVDLDELLNRIAVLKRRVIEYGISGAAFVLKVGEGE